LERLAEMIKARRREPRRSDPGRPVGVWTEQDALGGKPVDAFVAILRTRGCRWARTSGCSFCGYIADTNPAVTEKDLEQQMVKIFDKYGEEPYVKIFTSGSFFDDDEVPVKIQEKILTGFNGRGAACLSIESLPVFCTKEKVAWAAGLHPGLEVALGLESANDAVLERVVNKPFRYKDFVKAAGIAKETGARVKAYIVIKPPFLSEAESLEDAVFSAERAGKHVDAISFNPVNVQSGTLVNFLWRRRAYKPAWLWTVAEVLKRSHGFCDRLMSFPTAAGGERGPHNCGKCDRAITDSIKKYSLEGEVSLLDGLDCECRRIWRAEIETGNLAQTSSAIEWPRRNKTTADILPRLKVVGFLTV
jgi:radical SAM enzyme (TIGR01210 family)